MQITEAQREALREKQFLNAVKKVNAGRSITAREQAMIDGHLDADEPMYCHGQQNLADAVGLDVKTIRNFIKKHPDDLPGKKRGAESDGRFCIPDWRKKLAKYGIKPRGVNNREVDNERELRLREWKLKLDRAEFEIQKSKDLMLPVADFEAALGTTLGQFRSSLNALPGRAASKILNRARTAVLNMLRSVLTPEQFTGIDQAMSDKKAASVDYADVEEVLVAEVDLVLRTLEKCDYLPAP